MLTIAEIIKTVMNSSAEAEAEAEITVLYVTVKNMIPLRNTLIKMGWPQPQLPIQKDNSTAVGFNNKTIVNISNKSTDIKLWWLRDR